MASSAYSSVAAMVVFLLLTTSTDSTLAKKGKNRGNGLVYGQILYGHPHPYARSAYSPGTAYEPFYPPKPIPYNPHISTYRPTWAPVGHPPYRPAPVSYPAQQAYSQQQHHHHHHQPQPQYHHQDSYSSAYTPVLVYNQPPVAHHSPAPYTPPPVHHAQHSQPAQYSPPPAQYSPPPAPYTPPVQHSQPVQYSPPVQHSQPAQYSPPPALYTPPAVSHSHPAPAPAQYSPPPPAPYSPPTPAQYSPPPPAQYSPPLPVPTPFTPQAPVYTNKPEQPAQYEPPAPQAVQEVYAPAAEPAYGEKKPDAAAIPYEEPAPLGPAQAPPTEYKDPALTETEVGPVEGGNNQLDDGYPWTPELVDDDHAKRPIPAILFYPLDGPKKTRDPLPTPYREESDDRRPALEPDQYIPREQGVEQQSSGWEK